MFGTRIHFRDAKLCSNINLMDFKQLQRFHPIPGPEHPPTHTQTCVEQDVSDMLSSSKGTKKTLGFVWGMARAKPA